MAGRPRHRRGWAILADNIWLHGGNGPLRGAGLGSITHEIVHRAPLPVLVVPEGDG